MSTSGVFSRLVSTMSTSGRYYEYIGGYHEYIGGDHDACGDIMSTSGFSI